MKHRIIKLLVGIIVFIFLYPLIATGQTASSARRIPKGGLLSDVKAHRVGDIVTVIISENSQASNITNTQTNVQNDLSAEADFGGSFLKKLTGSISSQTQNQYRGSGQVSSTGRFTMQITARIIEIMEGGNFLIRGTREVETNGEKVVSIVEGIIRSEDITTQNTISSSQISDAKIYHQSKGVTADARKPGLISRILNWIF